MLQDYVLKGIANIHYLKDPWSLPRRRLAEHLQHVELGAWTRVRVEEAVGGRDKGE